MKKLINDPDAVVEEMIEGMCTAHDLRRLEGTTVVVRADAPLEGKVGVVSGGGAVTNRRTLASSVTGCSMGQRRGRCLRRRRPIR